MMDNYKAFLTLSLIFLLSAARAQMPNGRSQMGGQNMNLGHFYGKLVDASTSKPIEGATVQLVQNKMDTVTKKRKDVVIAGMLTKTNGEFSLENIPRACCSAWGWRRRFCTIRRW